jgi:glycosyltransferase involved in cell wall biosynthesis
MDDRRDLVIVANEQTPYRIHLHRRIALELAELRLSSLFTHEPTDGPRPYRHIDEIGPVLFGRGERASHQDRLWNQWREWRKGGRIIRWLAQRQVAAVVVFGYNDFGRVRLLRWCHRRGIPAFLWGDSNILGDNNSRLVRLKRAVLPHVLGWCSGAFCCGRLGRQYFLRYGVPPERIYQMPYEADYDAIRGVPLEKVQQVRNRYGLVSERRRLLYVGRLVPAKRVDLLIRAFAAIAAQRPNWDLVIAGDGPLRETLQALVPGPLRTRVTWTGFLPEPADVAALYAGCDVLVLPSDYEPWGVVVAEACTRLAIVASSVVGAAAELVQDGLNGRIFPAGELPQLAGALLEVTSADRIDAMKAASPRLLESWRRTADPVAGLRRALEDVGALAPAGDRVLESSPCHRST